MVENLPQSTDAANSGASSQNLTWPQFWASSWTETSSQAEICSQNWDRLFIVRANPSWGLVGQSDRTDQANPCYVLCHLLFALSLRGFSFPRNHWLRIGLARERGVGSRNGAYEGAHIFACFSGRVAFSLFQILSLRLFDGTSHTSSDVASVA